MSLMALQLQMSWQPSLLSQKRKNSAPLGLRNLGNTCYLNSVLQCLTYTPPLADFCLRNQHSSLCDYASSDSERKRDCPFCILERRIVRSLSADLTLDAPLKIQNCLKIFAEHFRLGRQEDAHEFLRYVIDACHNTCLRLKKLRRNDGACGIGGASVVKDIFGGSLQSQVKCSSCGNDSNKIDEMMDISLDILHSNSLKESLHKFFLPEVLDGTNKYKCDNCDKLVAARKQMSIFQAPNVLVIQLKRFEGIFGGKIDKAITFEEALLLSSFMCKTSQDPRPEYKLFGTIVHSGFSPESGHYYAYIKDAMGRWFCCNDSYVSVSSLQEVLSEKAYILFFSRTNQRPLSASTFLASNGFKSHAGNGCEAAKSPKTEPLVNGKSNGVQHSHKDLAISSKVDKLPSCPQMKFNMVGKSSPRTSTAIVNGKVVSTNHGTTMNVNEKHRFHVVPNSNDKLFLTNGHGVINQKKVDGVHKESGKTSVLVNGNGKASMKSEYNVSNDMSNKLTATKLNHEVHTGGDNCHLEVKGSKRKLPEGSCILLRQDAQSLAKVEALKEVLKIEAFSILRSNGWSEEVYNLMHSRKKLCEQQVEITSTSTSELKKLLISEVKPNLISRVPESLKENLIQRLRLFSQEK